MEQGMNQFGFEMANPDQVKAELPRVLWCEGHSRKIRIYLKINESLLYFFNINIFLALLVRITCLGVLSSISEAQLKSLDSWREVDTLENRNIWCAFSSLLKNESVCFVHMSLHILG
jgi:hypothetical protein